MTLIYKLGMARCPEQELTLYGWWPKPVTKCFQYFSIQFTPEALLTGIMDVTDVSLAKSVVSQDVQILWKYWRATLPLTPSVIYQIEASYKQLNCLRLVHNILFTHCFGENSVQQLYLHLFPSSMREKHRAGKGRVEWIRSEINSHLHPYLNHWLKKTSSLLSVVQRLVSGSSFLPLPTPFWEYLINKPLGKFS